MTDKNFFKSLLDNLIYDGVYFVDKNKTITYCNKGAELLTGYDDNSIIGKSFNEGSPVMKKDSAEHCLCLENILKNGTPVTRETYIDTIDGKNIPVYIKITPVKDNNGNIIGAVEVFNDNSAKMAVIRENDELRKMAMYDPLTNIPNRRYFEMSFKTRMEEFQRYKWNFGFLFIDIDSFKSFNDKYGHYAGDKALRIFAEKITNTLRPFDTFSRWGGEEFTAIVVNINKPLLMKIATRIRKIIENTKISIGDNETTGITVSIGGTMVKKSDSFESILKRADLLLYESKNKGRNMVSIG